MLTIIAVIFGLIVLNGLFVAAEFAIIGVPKAAVERAALGGSRLAANVLVILRSPRQQDHYIATAQVGITFASLGLGMYGEKHLAHALLAPLASLGAPSIETAHVIASAIAVASLTFLHIVLGEIVPKTLALQHAEGAALWVSTPMRWINWLFCPLTVPLEAAGNALLRVLGIERGHTTEAPTAEALRFMVDESVQRGELGPQAGEVMKELFSFSELSAAEIMIARQRIVGLPVGASSAHMHGIVRSAPHSRYPVYEGTLDGIVGMVLVRDVLKHLLEGTALSEDSIRSLPFVPGTARLDVVLARMRRCQTQMVVVMDEQGGTAGIVTTEDLFEEVIGQVKDGDAGLAPVYEQSGELHALGVARVEQVTKQLGLDLTHPEVDTVSGLVLTLLNRPPEVGDVVFWRGIELRVRSVEGRGVKECAVRLAPATPEDKDPLTPHQDTT
jgi:CBS domain containing-hemolysin-like protein